MLIVEERKRKRLSHGGASTREANRTLGFPKDFVVRAGRQGDFTKTQHRGLQHEGQVQQAASWSAKKHSNAVPVGSLRLPRLLCLESF